jgi:hypothetical protein
MTAVASRTAKASRFIARRRSPLGSRLTFAHVAPVLLAVVAFVLGLVVLQQRSATVLVPVASRAINAGDRVTPGSVRLVRVHAQDAEARAGLVAPGDLAASAGWVASVLIRAGDPITRSEVTKPAGPAGLGSMSLQVPVEHADGGALRLGDRVDVIGQVNGTAQYQARGLQVLAVASQDRSGGLVAAGSGGYFVVVAVDSTTALRLAQAVDARGSGAGVVDIVRTTGVAGDRLGSTPPSPAAGRATTAPASATAARAGAADGGGEVGPVGHHPAVEAVAV